MNEQAHATRARIIAYLVDETGDPDAKVARKIDAAIRRGDPIYAAMVQLVEGGAS